VLSANISATHQNWLKTPGKNGRKHKDNSMRTIKIPPKTTALGWSIAEYENRWDLIDAKLLGPNLANGV